MPKITTITLRGVHIINKFITSLTGAGKSSLVLTLVMSILITSLWTHTTRAEAPEIAAEKIVDGLTTSERAAKIDAYFAKYDLPLAGYGRAFVEAADREGLDWRFVAAKGMTESTGAKFMPKGSYNPFGWGCSTAAKCIRFESYEQAINEVTAHLAGNRPSTAKYYAGKTLSQKMASYNSVNPKYQTIVFGIMNRISAMETTSATLAMK